MWTMDGGRKAARKPWKLPRWLKDQESPVLKTLDPALCKGNLEAACREERYTFFSSLCHEHGYQAVLLAHHADDQAKQFLK